MPKGTRILLLHIAIGAVSAMSFLFLDLLRLPDNLVYRSLLPTDDRISNAIVIIDADDRTLDLRGNPFRDRGEFAAELATLAEYHPRVVGIDVIFETSRDSYGDDLLGTILGEHRNFIVATDDRGLAGLIPPIARHKPRTGYVSLTAHNGSWIGTAALDFDYFSLPELPLVFEVARQAMHEPPASRYDTLNWVDSLRTQDPTYSRVLGSVFVVNYSKRISGFARYSYYDVFRSDSHLLSDLRDKIVLFVGTAKEYMDWHPSPLGTLADPKTPGAEILANAVNTIVTRQHIHVMRPSILIVCTVAYLFALYALTGKVRYAIGLLAPLLVVSATMVIAWKALRFYYPLMPFVLATAGFALLTRIRSVARNS